VNATLSPVVRPPELVLGLIGPVGTDLDLVTDAFVEALRDVRYESHLVRLSSLLHELDWSQPLPSEPLDTHISCHMDGGNKLRRLLKRGDALALMAVGAVRHFRRTETSQPDEPLPRRAYLLRSLKHPDEVRYLRNIYGERFVVVAAYSPRDTRLHELAERIAISHHSMIPEDYFGAAQQLIRRDEAEEDDRYGQNVRQAFPLADFFVDARERGRLREAVVRTINILFAHPFQTPTADEYGMFLAEAAALRSAEMGRQVGAVVATSQGDVVAVGTNEVPKAMGGLYWTGGEPDARDFHLGYDTSDQMKRTVTGEVLERLKENGWLHDQRKAAADEDFYQVIRDTRLGSLIEFGRAVHAEMAAITDAARRGVSVAGCTLYTTTFPCHVCARHIVAAGITRVVYVAPYPKSLAETLHKDALVRDPDHERPGMVQVEPFVGVAPRRYIEFFTMPRRKDDSGEAVRFDRSAARPRVDGDLTYLGREKVALDFLAKRLDETRLSLRGKELAAELQTRAEEVNVNE
jgi:deoxycytidylate deaminase